MYKGKYKKSMQDFSHKTLRNRQFESSRQDNIKISAKETSWDDVDCIYLAQDRVQWQTFLAQ